MNEICYLSTNNMIVAFSFWFLIRVGSFRMDKKRYIWKCQVNESVAKDTKGESDHSLLVY